MSFFAILASESQPPTRCLDANDGWHDGVRRGDGVFCEATFRRILYASASTDVNSIGISISSIAIGERTREISGDS
jgi:hypothetical protein